METSTLRCAETRYVLTLDHRKEVEFWGFETNFIKTEIGINFAHFLIGKVMPSELLLGLCLIPSMLLIFVVLTTFYGANRAYIAISWLPITFVLVILIFRNLLAFQNLSDEWWRDLAQTIGWASLVQGALGVALLIRSLYNRKGGAILFLASSVSLFPFLLRYL